jgi:uncharacterized protein involved in tellurium resistance
MAGKAFRNTTLVNFLTIDANVFGSFDSQPYLVALDGDHRNDDVAVDYNLFATMSCQNEHGKILPGKKVRLAQ